MAQGKWHAIVGRRHPGARRQREVGVDVEFFNAATAADLEPAFAAARQWKADALVVTPGPLFNLPAARALGLTIPPALVARADELIR